MLWDPENAGGRPDFLTLKIRLNSIKKFNQYLKENMLHIQHKYQLTNGAVYCMNYMEHLTL